METPAYPKPLLMTDGAINIAPDLKTKRDIIQNVIDLAHAIELLEGLQASAKATRAGDERLAASVQKMEEQVGVLVAAGGRSDERYSDRVKASSPTESHACRPSEKVKAP